MRRGKLSFLRCLTLERAVFFQLDSRSLGGVAQDPRPPAKRGARRFQRDLRGRFARRTAPI